MPVYNAERWLPEAIESALAQTFEDFELVAVDDGSTDGSLRILEGWARSDPRLRIVRAAHGGLTRAREASLKEARGRFAAFLDADDRWLPNRLERQLPHVDDETLVFSDAFMATGAEEAWARWSEVVRQPGIEWPTQDLFPILLERNFILIPTVLAPTGQLLAAGGFRRAERLGFGNTGGCCDYEMWLALAQNGVLFDYVDEPLAIYRSHPEQMSAQVIPMAADFLRVLDSFEGEVRGPDLKALQRGRRSERRHLERAHRKEAWRHVLGSNRREARGHLVASLRANPRSPRAWLALPLFLFPSLASRLVRGRV